MKMHEASALAVDTAEAKAQAAASTAAALGSAKGAFSDTAGAMMAVCEGDAVTAASMTASAVFNVGVTGYNAAGAIAKQREAKRLADEAKCAAEAGRTMEALMTMVLSSAPEPSTKFSPEWYSWYSNEYDLWRKELITSISSDELFKQEVYVKRLKEIFPAGTPRINVGTPTAPNNFKVHCGGEIGLCVLEAWNCPLPLSRLDFVPDDAIRMFSAGGKLVRTRFDLRRMGFTLMSDTILEKIDAGFERFEKGKIKASSAEPDKMCFGLCPMPPPIFNVAIVPGFVTFATAGLVGQDGLLINQEIGIDTVFAKKEDKALRTTALRYQAFRFLAVERGYAVDDGVLALQTVVINFKARALGLSLVDLRTLRPDELLIKSAVPEIMQMASPRVV